MTNKKSSELIWKYAYRYEIDNMEPNGIINIWSFFIETLKEVEMLISSKWKVKIYPIKDQQELLINFVKSLSNEELESYTMEICKLDCVNISDEDIGKKIWNMTIKEYQDKFDGLQGEGYYDEMLVSDLDSTLEAVNHGKLSHTISY